MKRNIEAEAQEEMKLQKLYNDKERDFMGRAKGEANLIMGINLMILAVTMIYIIMVAIDLFSIISTLELTA